MSLMGAGSDVGQIGVGLGGTSRAAKKNSWSWTSTQLQACAGGGLASGRSDSEAQRAERKNHVRGRRSYAAGAVAAGASSRNW